MAYVALYRTFRPQKFDELVGQDAIVRTLKHQLASGRVAHAYLFAGPRGTGKTSTAKLFARAINCAHPLDGDPCGQCDACLAAQADDTMDIIEIDAASNNGVDNIRDIRDKVVFAPAQGKYKVYIIDEVHMLSGGAFNALLKTLEEPPAHVVFILATTEIHKLPATILSRCQRFDFHLIPAETIARRLKDVLGEVGAQVDDEAIELIAKSAQGGMRDALSLADVCLSYCGDRVTLEDARRVLGVPDRRFLFAFTDALLASDAREALTLCRAHEDEGNDVGGFVLDELAHLRDLLLCVFAPACAQLQDLTRDAQEKLKEQAARADVQRLLRALEIFSRVESELKAHTRPDIELETAAVRICTPEAEADFSALADRVAVLEQARRAEPEQSVKPNKREADEGTAKTGASVPSAPPWEEAPAPRENTAVPEEKKQDAPPNRAPEKPGGAADAPALWAQLLARVKAGDLPLYMMIRHLDGAASGEVFTVYIPETAKNKEELIRKNASALAEHLKAVS
ncbi:MAG: DNA polymerase III subunit gamma/tau, partial [Clostridia bacterium]|nr:DNA polymerase III subunit gamma/tau [Clostridia bacterium]